MSLIALVQGAARRVGITPPAVAIGSTDPMIQIMVDFLQDAGDEAVERVDWQALKFITPITFTGDGVTAAFALPNGFQRLSPSTTFVSSVYPTMKMVGPVDEGALLRLKATPMATYPSVWREAQGKIEFYPVLGAGEVVTYVYASGLWVTDQYGAQYSTPAWVADTDLAMVPDRVLRLGAIWRWRKKHGFDYGQDFDDYEAALDRIGGQETTGTIVSMSNALPEHDTWPGIITDLTVGA